MQALSLPQLIAVFAVPGIFAITLHEVAHGWMARYFGDRTAELLGRLSLNPLKHVDPIGTVVVPIVLLLMQGWIFGWARPVPVASRNFKEPRRHMAIVAAAGPLSNLAMACAWVLVARVALMFGGAQGGLVAPLVYAMGLAGLYVNVLLATVNLLPIPPLDGGRVLNGFLPPRISDKFERLEPFGLVILLLLLWRGWLSPVLSPVVGTLLVSLTSLAGVPLGDLQLILQRH
jgi:Zn-dependent protease